jgi:hypothetical protein
MQRHLRLKAIHPQHSVSGCLVACQRASSYLRSARSGINIFQTLGVCLFDMLQGRQPPNGFPRLLLRDAQVVQTLQVEPELSVGTEKVGESQSGIARDGAFPIQDFGDAVRRNIELPRKLRRAHAQFFQFFGQMLARVNSGYCHDGSPNGNQQSPRWMGRAHLRATQSKSAIAH